MKKKNYRCNSCMTATFYTPKALISHVRAEHPQDGFRSCWDAVGDLGDEFANVAMAHMQETSMALRKRVEAAEAKVKEYDALVKRYDGVIRALQIIKPAVDIAVSETWK
jgi:hypothetical protein